MTHSQPTQSALKSNPKMARDFNNKYNNVQIITCKYKFEVFSIILIMKF